MKSIKAVGENEYKLLKEAYASIKKKVPYRPEVAIVLGTGLGGFAESLKVDKEIKFNEIENLPKATNENHKGSFIFAHVGNIKVVCMKGRIHYYEGYDILETIRPIRLIALFGAKKIILTNASGGINKNYDTGDIMLIKDHISFLVPNPLRGKNIDELGMRFVDMTDTYDEGIRKIVKKVAKIKNINIKEGVYVQTPGPTFETAAEIRFLSAIGADAVAMSLGIEAIAAAHAGLKVCGFSMITNKATGLSKGKQSDEEVKENASRNAKKLEVLIKSIIPEITKM